MGPKGSNINHITKTTGCVIEVPKNRNDGEPVILNIHSNNNNADGLGQAFRMVSEVFA